MHSAIKVARHFVDKAKAAGQVDMTLLKLIKITYIAHGWMLAVHNRPLISEDVEAWQYGPVIPELYREIKRFGKNSIEALDDIDCVDLDNQENSIVTQTHEKYSGFRAAQLVELTHKEGTPWFEVTDGGRDIGRGLVIENDKIADYYRSLL